MQKNSKHHRTHTKITRAGKLTRTIIAPLQSFFTDEDMNLIKKFKLYVEDNWNKCDMVAIFLFIIGVTCRLVSFKSFAPVSVSCDMVRYL